ncbi:hypothetical protein LXL04_033189 [Taraxacum kok-saghyz]
MSFEKSAFVAGRQILDGPLMVNEVVSWVKKNKRKLMIFKVNFEKAYDSVSWSYLEKMMQYMGFSDKWRFWIRACLLSSRSSVLVNGNATTEFSLHRGLRQGDHLSPFLFIIVMEGLHVLMEDVVPNRVFMGVKIGPDNLCVSHLFYADDALFFGAKCRMSYGIKKKIPPTSSSLANSYIRENPSGFLLPSRSNSAAPSSFSSNFGRCSCLPATSLTPASHCRKTTIAGSLLLCMCCTSVAIKGCHNRFLPPQPFSSSPHPFSAVEGLHLVRSYQLTKNTSRVLTKTEGRTPGNTAATTSPQLRRSDRGIACLCVSVRVTSHYFASVALSVRGWVGAWPESSGRSGST